MKTCRKGLHAYDGTIHKFCPECRQVLNRKLNRERRKESAPPRKLKKSQKFTVSYALTRENRPQRRARKVRARLIRQGRIAA